jgi:hypothetical protein
MHDGSTTDPSKNGVSSELHFFSMSNTNDNPEHTSTRCKRAKIGYKKDLKQQKNNQQPKNLNREAIVHILK